MASASATIHAERNSDAQANDERPPSISGRAEGEVSMRRACSAIENEVATWWPSFQTRK